MLLKYHYLLKDTFIENENPIEIPLSKKIHIIFRRISDDEKPNLLNYERDLGRAIVCETTLIKELREKNLEIFQALAQNQIPENVRQDMYLKQGDHLNLSHFPKHFIEFCEQLDVEVRNSSKAIWGLLRWKFNLLSPHNAFTIIDKLWSFDGNDWKKLPMQDNIRAYLIIPHVITEQDCQVIIDDYNNGIREPLAHELFRESWTGRFQNKKSSIVIGIAALETSVKSFISQQIPKATWLISEIQSPPIEKIIKEFLPKLFTKDGIEKKVSIVPDKIMKHITKGISIRNSIVHGKECNLTPTTMDEILVSIKYVLHLLDYYSGNDWAKQHVRHQPINVFN